MDLVGGDGVAVQVADGLDLETKQDVSSLLKSNFYCSLCVYLVCFPFQFDFVALHDLLDGGTDVAETGVNAGLFNASLGGLEIQRIKTWPLLQIDRCTKGNAAAILMLLCCCCCCCYVH